MSSRYLKISQDHVIFKHFHQKRFKTTAKYCESFWYILIHCNFSASFSYMISYDIIWYYMVFFSCRMLQTCWVLRLAMARRWHCHGLAMIGHLPSTSQTSQTETKSAFICTDLASVSECFTAVESSDMFRHVQMSLVLHGESLQAWLKSYQVPAKSAWHNTAWTTHDHNWPHMATLLITSDHYCQRCHRALAIPGKYGSWYSQTSTYHAISCSMQYHAGDTIKFHSVNLTLNITESLADIWWSLMMLYDIIYHYMILFHTI